jgi:hypothetical protein
MVDGSVQGIKDSGINPSAKRETAVHVRVLDILQGGYNKKEGWEPNAVEIGDFRFSRVNVLGVIVSSQNMKEGLSSQVFVLDDGSGQVMLRSFESRQFDVAVGDIVVVVGRPRDFDGERYIMPELVRKVDDPRWVDVRRAEIDILEFGRSSLKSVVVDSAVAVQQDIAVVEDVGAGEFVSGDALVPGTLKEVSPPSPVEVVVKSIRDKDSGDGVAFEDISSACPGLDVESLLKHLLESGDIFEMRPGRYKVLE